MSFKYSLNIYFLRAPRGKIAEQNYLPAMREELKIKRHRALVRRSLLSNLQEDLIMKKLIVLSVIFALTASVAFALELSGSVTGSVTPVQSDTSNATDGAITSGGHVNRVRLEGYGETANGHFGGWIRAEGGFQGFAFWRPISQFKLTFGSSSDGFWGKEGVTGWMLNQTPYDTDVAILGNIWGESTFPIGIKTRDVFFGGYGQWGAAMEIKPVDVLSINIGIPFISMNGAETVDVLKSITAQLDFNLAFGNIALTYVGGRGYKEGTDTPGTWLDSNGMLGSGMNVPDDALYVYKKPSNDGYDEPGTIFAYYGGSFGGLGVDVGFSYKFPGGKDGDVANPVGVGLGLKYATDAFGIKFRVVATMAGDDKATRVLADILPYFPIANRLTGFVNAGIGLLSPDTGDTTFGWYFNPYLQVGEEWGAKFLAGLKVWSTGDDVTHWAIPLAISIGF